MAGWLLDTRVRVSSMLPEKCRRGLAWLQADRFAAAENQICSHLSRFVFSIFAKHIFLVEK